MSRRSALAAGLLYVVSNALAAPWNELKDVQRGQLADLSDHRDSFDAKRRNDILRGLERWQSLSDSDRELRALYRDFTDLPEERRSKIREQFERERNANRERSDAVDQNGGNTRDASEHNPNGGTRNDNSDSDRSGNDGGRSGGGQQR